MGEKKQRADSEGAAARREAERLRDQTEELRLLYEAGRLLGRTLDPDVIYDTMHEMISQVMDCDSLIVSSYNPEDNLIRCSYAWIEGRRVDARQFPAIPLAPEGRGMQSKVIRTGEPLIVRDVMEEAKTRRIVHYFHATAEGTMATEPSTGIQATRSTVMVPVKLEERVLGAVQVMSQRQDAYTADHLRLLEALMIQVAAASRNAFLYQQAREEIAERKRVEEENARLMREKEAAAIQQRVFLRDVLMSVTEGKLRLCDAGADLPAPLASAAGPIALAPEALGELRRVTQEVAIAQGLCPERWHDLITAAGEAAMNAVVHAGGGHAWVGSNETGVVQVRVEDQGTGIAMEHLPRATLEPGYTTAGTMGHGFWMMLKTADRIWLLTGPSGTTVVLEQDREAPLPHWLQEF